MRRKKEVKAKKHEGRNEKQISKGLNYSEMVRESEPHAQRWDVSISSFKSQEKKAQRHSETVDCGRGRKDAGIKSSTLTYQLHS